MQFFLLYVFSITSLYIMVLIYDELITPLLTQETDSNLDFALNQMF